MYCRLLTVLPVCPEFYSASGGTDDPACTQFAEQAELTLIFAFDEVREYMVNRYDGEYPVD